MSTAERLQVAEKRLLIDGKWIESDSWEEIRSPYSGEVVGRVPLVGGDVAREAVGAAAAAMREPLPAWRRAEILERTATLICERSETLADRRAVGDRFQKGEGDPVLRLDPGPGRRGVRILQRPVGVGDPMAMVRLDRIRAGGVRIGGCSMVLVPARQSTAHDQHRSQHRCDRSGVHHGSLIVPF